MNTLKNKRTMILQRDPISYLEQNLKISNFSPKTIKAYLYYNKELFRFANYCINTAHVFAFFLTYLICRKRE